MSTEPTATEVPLRGVAQSALGHAREYLSNVVHSLTRTSNLLHASRIEDANSLFALSIDALGVLVFVLESSSRALGEVGADLAGVSEECDAWLSALIEAQERKDWIDVADQLEYEVLPGLEQWDRRINLALERSGCGVA